MIGGANKSLELTCCRSAPHWPERVKLKKAFRILKNRPTISIVLTRDSVAAGDDCDAPHEKTIKIHSFVDPVDLARESSSGYLPNVSGVGHSWICVLNDIKIAEIKEASIQSLVKMIEFKENNRIHYKYKSARY
jgi:hypothetical protein